MTAKSGKTYFFMTKAYFVDFPTQFRMEKKPYFFTNL